MFYIIALIVIVALAIGLWNWITSSPLLIIAAIAIVIFVIYWFFKIARWSIFGSTFDSVDYSLKQTIDESDMTNQEKINEYLAIASYVFYESDYENSTYMTFESYVDKFYKSLLDEVKENPINPSDMPRKYKNLTTKATDHYLKKASELY